MATKRELTGSILSAASDLRDLSDEDLDLLSIIDLKSLDERIWQTVESIEDLRAEARQESTLCGRCREAFETVVERKRHEVNDCALRRDAKPPVRRCQHRAYRGTGVGVCNQILDDHGQCNLARLHTEGS